MKHKTTVLLRQSQERETETRTRKVEGRESKTETPNEKNQRLWNGLLTDPILGLDPIFGLDRPNPPLSVPRHPHSTPDVHLVPPSLAPLVTPYFHSTLFLSVSNQLLS